MQIRKSTNVKETRNRINFIGYFMAPITEEIMVSKFFEIESIEFEKCFKISDFSLLLTLTTFILVKSNFLFNKFRILTIK